MSKTALTRMLFRLKNITSTTTVSNLMTEIYQSLKDSATQTEEAKILNVLLKLCDFWGITEDDISVEDRKVWQNVENLANQLCLAKASEVIFSLKHEFRVDPGLDPLAELSLETMTRAIGTQFDDRCIARLLIWLIKSAIANTPDQSKHSRVSLVKK